MYFSSACIVYYLKQMHITFAIYLIVYLIVISRRCFEETRIMHARGNSRNRERKPGLRYFRGSRVNFCSDGEHRESLKKESRITDVIICKKVWNY